MKPKKIIGGTVGMGLPKPNLMQTDHTKGDYVKGKEEFLAQAGSGQNPTDYTALTNKPKINGVELSGNKTAAELGIEGATDEQVQTAVREYLTENPVSAEVTPQWAEFPRATNPARDIYNAVSMANHKVLGTEGTLRHNMMLEGDLITWMESTGNVDYADSSGAAHVKLMGWYDYYGTGPNVENPAINYTSVKDVFPAGSEILGVDGEVIDTVVATSDNAIVNLGSYNYLILSGCQGAKSYHMIYRTCNYQPRKNSPTFGETIHVLKINGAEWDMRTLREDYHNRWSQINTKVVKNGNNYYMAVVQGGVGVAIMQSADGMDWSLAKHIDDTAAHLEACVGIVSWVGANMPSAYVVVRHKYGDGYISLYGLSGVAGKVMTKTLIPASTGRPMLSSYLSKDLYLAYSVNGRKNAVLAQILPNSDGSSGISILETPREIMSNYPVLMTDTSTVGNRYILFGGTNGLNTKNSGVSVAYLWNENPGTMNAKNKLLKDVLFGKAVTVTPTLTEGVEIGSVGGTKLYAPELSAPQWETIGDVTTTEETNQVVVSFASRKFNRIAIYAVLVGTETNTEEGHLAIDQLGVLASGAVGKTGTKYARIMYDVTPMGSFIRGDYDTNNKFTTDIVARSVFGGLKSTTSKTSLTFTSGNVYSYAGRMFGVGTRFLVLAQ